MKYRIWHSAEGFADYIIDKTILKDRDCEKAVLYESDCGNPKFFHTLPDHIKKIMYLDAPDVIVECGQEPIFSIEITTEAGTGHNVFQRFARLAAAVENNVPAIYIYPEAVAIKRKENESPKWDAINPLIFRALEKVMGIYQIPALLFYYPSDYREYKNNAVECPNINSKGLKKESPFDYAASPSSKDSEMQKMFDILNDIISAFEDEGISSRPKLLSKRNISKHITWMSNEAYVKNVSDEMSPLTATKEIPTEYLLNHLEKYQDKDYKIGELLRTRRKTIIYCIDAGFRGDPYPGALAAIDYLVCREGKTFEERDANLVLCWGNVEIDYSNETINIKSKKCSVNDFINAVKQSESKNLLTKDYDELRAYEIPRYYMQVRYGSTYSKVKHIRVFSYFADAILFKDGALWRDA